MTINQMMDKRLRIWEEAKALNDKTKAENRVFTAEEQISWEKMNVDIDGLARQIQAEEQAEARVREFTMTVNPGVGREETNGRIEPADREKAQAAFRNWLRFGDRHLNEEEVRILAPYRVVPDREGRALSVGTQTAGGFTVAADTSFYQQIDRALKAFGGMRQAARVLQTSNGADLPVPTVNDTAQVGEIIAENATHNQQDVAFGQLVLKAYEFSSKIVLVPRQLLQDAAIDIEGLLGGLLGERIGRIENTMFTTGTGAAQPKGVVVGGTQGKLAASATAIAPDELFDLFHSVDPAYRDGPQVFFMFRDSTLQAIRKLKDTTNQYLFRPDGSSLSAGAPDLILGKRYVINQDVAAIATGAKTVLFGDFSKYWIRDVTPLILRRSDDRYFEFDQIAFLAIQRSDGNLLDAGTSPIKYLQQA
jgi:HK97 family phage major capsid protein